MQNILLAYMFIFTPKIFHQFEQELSSAFYGKPLNFRENDKDEIIDLVKINVPSRPIFSNQPHKNKIQIVSGYQQYIGVDSFITQEKKLPLLIKTADCTAALFFDPVTKTIAAVHAGWRGLIQKIFTKALQKMKMEFKVQPSNLFVFLSPSIHSPKFSDPFQETPEFFHPFVNEKNQVDLWAIAKTELRGNGMSETHIEMPAFCTFTDPKKRCWSHRQGDTKRNGAVIWMK